MRSLTPTAAELDLINSIHFVNELQIERLAAYFEKLVIWQKKTNLVSNSTLDDFWTRHVADSLQIFSLKKDKLQWTDLGSGGGFPAIVIAIMLGRESQGEVRLVESTQKKCAFLRQVGNITNSPIKVFCQRIESATKQIEDAEIVTARALASLSKLFELTDGLIVSGRSALFHKGRDFRHEIEECNRTWDFDLIVHQSKIDADSVVLEVSEIRRKTDS